MSVTPERLPVFLLTGFLGSGKTTLLARLLADPALADTAVLINEFGAIGLDHHLVGRIDETMVLLASGCLCCTIRGELAEAIRALLGRRDRGEVPPFRRLIVETTGLADPLPIIATFSADPVLKHHVRCAGVVTTIDAVNGLTQLGRHPESLAQAAAADRLVLTKTDLCATDAAAAVVAALRVINPDAPLVSGNAAADAATLLGERPVLDGTAAGFRCAAAGDAPARHGSPAAALALVIEAAIDWTLFGLWLTMLLNRHGAAVLRVKGLLNVEGCQTPVAIHGAGPLVHVPTHLPAWPDQDRRSRLVFVVRGLDPAAIRASLIAFGFVPALTDERAQASRL